MAWTNAVWVDHNSVKCGDMEVVGGASGYVVLTKVKNGTRRLVRMETMLACEREMELFFEVGIAEQDKRG